ncbi:MAG: phosphoadenylyl-sulfate reductase, partial [Rubrobacter sp.]|nr:phosphoadenylyl-sulfate reductase [Rubrobacter sp.]
MSEVITSHPRGASGSQGDSALTEDLERLREEAAEASRELEGRSPEEILRWAVGRFGGDLALSVSFGGPEGMVLLDMLSRLVESEPDLAADRSARPTVITIDTGFLFSETVRFRERTMRRYRNLNLEVAGPALSVEEQVERYGVGMYGCKPDTCCQIRKVEPMRRTLANYESWMTGIRREQTNNRADTPVVGIDEQFRKAKVAPLAGWSAEEVEGYVEARDVPVNPLLNQGYASIGCWPQTRPVGEGEDWRAG